MNNTIIIFTTKRNINGNRHYLAIDEASKVYSVNPSSWYSTNDYNVIEVSKKHLNRLIDFYKTIGYSPVDTL